MTGVQTCALPISEIELEDLLKLMPGPDFATGGIINATPEELYNVYATGLGKIKVRGKVEVRDIGYGRKSICVTELPYTMIGGTAKFLDTVQSLSGTENFQLSWILRTEETRTVNVCVSM